MKKLETFPSPLHGYLHHANVLTTIKTSNFHPLLLNNFINLQCERDLPINRGGKLDFTHESFHIYEEVVEIEKLHNDTIKYYKNGLADFIKDMIDKTRYIELIVNEFYIPGTHSYQRYNFDHNILVHGYDDNREIFYIKTMINYFYRETEVSYSILNEAFSKVSSMYTWSSYTKVFQVINPDGGAINRKRIIEFMSDYLQGTSRYKSTDFAYGLDVYEIIEEYINLLIQEKNTYDLRILHLLWEHKKLMTIRGEYFQSKGILGESTLLALKDIENQVLILRNLQIKYNLTKSKVLLAKISNELKKIKQSETALWEKIIGDLLRKEAVVHH